MRCFRILLIILIIGLSNCYAATSDNGTLTLKVPQPQTGSSPAGSNNTVTQTTESLRDIYGPVSLPTSIPPSIIIIAALCLLAGIAAFIWWRRRKKSVPPLPPLPPWQTALHELDAARKLMTSHDALLYMNQCSQILRNYIENRFGILSTRQTTGEFLVSLQKSGNSSPLFIYRSELQHCLVQADMAKFAHQQPENIEHLEHMETAVRGFIERTIPHQSKEEI